MGSSSRQTTMMAQAVCIAFLLLIATTPSFSTEIGGTKKCAADCYCPKPPKRPCMCCGKATSSFLANAKGTLSATKAAESIVPVYRHKYSGAGCGTHKASAITNVDATACEAMAAAAKHPYFNTKEVNGTHQCETLDSCDIRTGSGWSVSKLWLGAYSATSSALKPHDDGLGLTPMAVKSGCLTQVSVLDKAKFELIRNHGTCTSCNPNTHVFMLTSHTTMSGMCVKYKKAVELRCAGVNTNEFANPQQSSYICTKVIQSWSLLWSGQLDEPAKKYYNPVATGAERKVLAMCNVRKEVVCYKNQCDQKSEITCANVCQLKWRRGRMTPGKCDPKLCEGKYGELACILSGPME